jgi:hypothetical protein
MIKTSKITTTHTKKYMDERYAKYVERYNKAKAVEAARGYNMLSDKMTRVQFENNYQIYRDTALETGRYNKDIIGEIVRDQRYGLKRYEAAAFAKSTQALGTGKSMSVQEIMHMKPREVAKLYEAELSQAYYDAKSAGMDSTDASLWVSQVWFGSK